MGNASLLPLRTRILQSRAPFHSFTIIINIHDVDKISVMNEESGGSMLLFLSIKTSQTLKPIFISGQFSKRVKFDTSFKSCACIITHVRRKNFCDA